MATQTFTEFGKVLREAKYKYVTPQKINTLCNKILSANSRYAMKSIGGQIQSQHAYEVLSKGPIRPLYRKSDPILYDLKCIDFKPPYFTLKMNCVNEYPLFIYHLINELGIKLKSYSCVSSMILSRIGTFTVDDALSYKEIDLQNILNNITKNYNNVEELLQKRDFIQYQNINFNNKHSVGESSEQAARFESPLINS